MNKNAYLFFGKPGSGKGTQVKLFNQYLTQKGEKSISFGLGSYIRQKKTEGNVFFKHINESIINGSLVPSCVTVWSFVDFLHDNFFHYSHFVFDGITRKQNEAKDFIDLLKILKFETLNLFILNVEDKCAIERVLNRKDDRNDNSLTTIVARLKTYNDTSLESFKIFYHNDFINIFNIDASRSREEIHKIIINTYDNKK